VPAETLSAKEAARELGTDARTFRKFMRATTAKEDQPGQGNRYAIKKTSIKKLKTAFDEWNKPKQKAVPLADEDKLDDEALEEMMISEDEDFLADEVDVDEPSDEELGEIEGEEDFDLTNVEEL
jgi:hypothetical protein